MPTSAHETRTANGFTLLELLIVLAIAALAATIMGSLAGRGARTGGLDQAQLVLVNAFLESRAAAMATGRPWRVSIDPATRVVGVGPGRGERRFGVTVDVVVTYAFETARGPVPEIVFYPDGTTTGGSIRLRLDADERLIEVHWLTGQVRTRG